MEIASQIARHPHEKRNGRGYPDGLAGIFIDMKEQVAAIRGGGA